MLCTPFLSNISSGGISSELETSKKLEQLMVAYNVRISSMGEKEIIVLLVKSMILPVLALSQDKTL